MKFDTALKPRVVLAVGAHADDMDVTAGGAMAAWSDAGAKVHYLVLTDGGKGTADRPMDRAEIVARRRDEQAAAARTLGVAKVESLDFGDGELVNSDEVRREVVKAIRRLQPDVVVTLDPALLYNPARGIINHADHRAAGQAVLDAVYPLARNLNAFPELLKEGLQPHKVKTVLLAQPQEPNFVIDISATMERKLRALEAHASQFGDAADIKRSVSQWAAEDRAGSGYKFAEPFVRIDLA
jgi:LmbE family N-acetylglucosaminyl deacetylase